MAISIQQLELLRRQMEPLAADLSRAARVVAVSLEVSSGLAVDALMASVEDTEENRRNFGESLRRLSAALSDLAVAAAPVVAAIGEHGATLAAAADQFDPPTEEDEE
jgi:hypothetical protein